MELTCDTEPGFIGVKDSCRLKSLPDGRYTRFKEGLCSLASTQNRGLRDRQFEKIVHQTGGAFYGEQVKLGQMDQSRADPRAVLNRGGDVSREMTSVNLAARTALNGRSAMLNDLIAELGEFKDLT